MKKLTTLLFCVFMMILLMDNSHAQKLNVDASKSTIVWTGKKILGEHTGTIKLKNGMLMIEDNKISNGSFAIDMRSIECTDLEGSGRDKLVGHLKSDDFFGVEKYPVATFKVKKSTAFKNNKATLTGDLTIKEKTNEISFEITKNNNEYSASIEVDRSKFDVRYGSDSFFDNLGDNVIYDIFNLEVNLSAN